MIKIFRKLMGSNKTSKFFIDRHGMVRGYYREGVE